MECRFTLNGKKVHTDVSCDQILLDLLRELKCYSVKRGCETSNCGACTVLMNGRPVLSCSILAMRADGTQITTLEGLQQEAEQLGAFIADQGAEQCGFCNPGFMINTIAMLREIPDPTDEEIKEYLSGNLCRCSGYESQFRGIKAYIDYMKGTAGNE